MPPGVPVPRWWMADRGSGPIHRAGNLRDLATKIGVPADALAATIDRFNTLAQQGHDDDFGRGEKAWGRFWGDGKAAHPNLGPVDQPPFYAVAVWPGELSTKGGVRIDEHARALRPDGTPIAGLFACGNTSASIMGDSYPGGGATIGPAMVMGYIAADRMANSDMPAATEAIVAGVER
jgi:3-oxosteroid 1-dehydrogenase